MELGLGVLPSTTTTPEKKRHRAGSCSCRHRD